MKKDSPLKILITAPSLDESKNVSGISTVVRQIVENGTFDYTHFTAGRQDGERQDAVWLFKQAALPIQFYQRLKREKIDVAHINTAFNPLSIMRDLALAKAAKRAGKPLLLHIHGGKFLAREFEKDWLKKVAAEMLKTADAVVVLSELEKEILLKREQISDVKVLENAVAVEDFVPTEKRKNSMIFLGRMHESKGLNEIIETARTLKNEGFNFTFRAFGAGGLQEFFVAEMSQILGEKFYFGSVIAGNTKQKELSEADIFVLPSRYGEGLPMALLEAMAARCIVVVSEMASIGAVVENGVNGFLIEPQNVSQLTAKLRTILSDKIDLTNVRDKARITVETKFNLRDYIEKLEEIYRRIYSKKKS